MGGYHTSGSAQGVQVVGSYAYVTDGAVWNSPPEPGRDNVIQSGGLRVIDVSNPAGPVRVGGYDTGGASAYGVQVVGNHAYVANGEAGLQILELRLGLPQTLTWMPPPARSSHWMQPIRSMLPRTAACP